MYFAVQRMQNIFCLIFKQHDYICNLVFVFLKWLCMYFAFQRMQNMFCLLQNIEYFLCIKAKEQNIVPSCIKYPFYTPLKVQRMCFVLMANVIPDILQAMSSSLLSCRLWYKWLIFALGISHNACWGEVERFLFLSHIELWPWWLKSQNSSGSWELTLSSCFLWNQ